MFLEMVNEKYLHFKSPKLNWFPSPKLTKENKETTTQLYNVHSNAARGPLSNSKMKNLPLLPSVICDSLELDVVNRSSHVHDNIRVLQHK